MLDTTTPYPDDAARLAAMRRREAAADGHFFCCIASTGVYCYPSCAARPALLKNISFHLTRAAAEQAGFRACKRCRPELPPRAEREAAVVAAACRAIEAAEDAPALAGLAAAAGLSAAHFHRLFRRVAGVTPKAYGAVLRQARVQQRLAAGDGVTAALYEAGFSSSGRFYEAAEGMLGMTPSRYRAGGAGEAIRHAVARCSLGMVLVAATARGVCAILLGDDAEGVRADLRARFPRAVLTEATVGEVEDGFAGWVGQVVAAVDDPRRALALPLDISGTAFQRRVWEVLRAIPVGETLSYGAVAARLGAPRAVRAVAGACGANKLAVAVPCHRVVAGDGGLGGYRYGVARKQALLDRERDRGERG